MNELNELKRSIACRLDIRPTNKEGQPLTVIVVELRPEHPRVDGIIIPMVLIYSARPVLNDPLGTAAKPHPRVDPLDSVRHCRYGGPVKCFTAVPIIVTEAVELRIEAVAFSSKVYEPHP